MIDGAKENPIHLKSEEVVVKAQKGSNMQNTDIEVQTDINNLPEAVQKKLKETYATIVEKELNSKLKDHLASFLTKLESADVPGLKKGIIDSMSPENQQLYKSFMDPVQQKSMSYETVRHLYSAVQTSVDKNAKDINQAPNRVILNAASNGLKAMQPLVNNNIPDLMVKAKKIAVMQETRFIRTPKKKSLFRRIIEAVFPFTKKDDEIITKKVEEKISAPEKAMLNIATGAVSDYMSKAGDKFFTAFDNAVDYQKRVAKGNAIELTPTHEQALRQEQSKKEKEPSVAKKAANLVKTAAEVAYSVDKGVNEWIAAKLNTTAPGAYLEKVLTPGTEVKETTLAAHFSNEFTMASQKQAHDGMVHFARNLAELYITANRVKQNGYVDMAPEKFGFKRLDDPNFEKFLARLVNSLGYPMNGFDDLQKFLASTVDPKTLQEKDFPSKATMEKYQSELQAEQKAAFDKFSSALPNDPSLGIHAAVTLMSKEHTGTMTQKGNENYFYLVNLQQQAIAQLKSNDRLHNAVGLACRELGIEESVYNHQDSGLKTKISGQLKSQLVGRMPDLVQGFIHEARELQQNANNQFDVMFDNWLRKISDLQVNAVETTTPKVKGKSDAQLRDRWDKSANKPSKLAFEFDEVKKLVSDFHDSALKEWKKSAIPLLTRSADLEGPAFLGNIIKQLNSDMAELKAQGAHESYGKEIQKQIIALKSMLSPDGKSFNQELLKAASPDILKSAFDAVKNGAASLYAKDKTLSLDTKENLYMMTQAFGSLNTSYSTFDMAKKAYEEVYRTNFDELSTMSSSKVATYIAEKLGKMLENAVSTSMSAPVVQFEFYAEQKIAGKHKLPELREPQNGQVTKPQGWVDWGKNQLSWAASYVAPVVTPLAAKAAEAAALPVLIGAGSAYLAKLYLTDVAPDPKSVNQAVCDNAKVFIREQAYDAMLQMLPQMFVLHASEQRFQQNYSTANHDPFKQCGLADRQRFYNLMNNVAKGLGYDNIAEYMEFENQLQSKIGQVEKCREDLQATWFYQDKSELQEKLENAEDELAVLVQIKEAKRQQFTKLPETQAELDKDLFVSLKDAIQMEYAKLSEDIQKGKLADGTNYLVLVSSFNAMIQQIELVQKETIASELFAPDIDKAIGYNPQESGVLAQLKAASREDMKTYGSMAARQGILSQLTTVIDNARYFSAQMISAASEDMNVALNKHVQQIHSAPAAQTSSATKFAAKQAEEDPGVLSARAPTLTAAFAQHKSNASKPKEPQTEAVKSGGQNRPRL